MKYKLGEEILVRGWIEAIKSNSCKVSYSIKFNNGSKGVVPEEDVLQNKTYSDGLADAWELAKKIVCTKGGMPYNEIEAIFGSGCAVEDILLHITAEEALAKIEAYERENEIKVGDVVKIFGCNSKGVIVSVDYDYARILWANGISGIYTKDRIEKTGKHIDIEGLLRQIGE